MKINFQSTKVFYTEICFNDTVLATGSSFIGGNGKNYLLFTNRHNVTGRNNETDELLSTRGAIPNNLKVTIPNIEIHDSDSAKIRSRYQYYIPLFEDVENFESKRWVDHPTELLIDAVGIKINFEGLDLENLSYFTEESWFAPEIDLRVNIIGFPFGLSIDRFPIWTSGYIASEPSLDYNNLPMFLVDCRTRKGQSGSPVVLTFQKGATRMDGDTKLVLTKNEVHLLGIYSGRVNSESDIGRVWKTRVLSEILNCAYD